MDLSIIGQIVASALIGAALIAVALSRRVAEGAGAGLDDVPFAAWMVDRGGTEVARNAACAALGVGVLPAAAGRVALGGGWFDVVVRQAGRRQIFAAVPADGQVRAEAALRDFRTTMSDTFAQLETGLGLFDAEGRLQMFNPAMADLTGVPIDFLMRRPSFGAVLDALRDRGILPEPKDWMAWRRRMLELPLTAGAGTHSEDWGLAGGVTYRATLRPQAKGSFAFLIEDISTEIIRSRRYRADMELAQSVIDTLEEGIAVFAGTGQLVLSNAAYSAVWGHDPGTMLEQGSIGQIADYWRGLSAPDPLWTRIEAFVATPDGGEGWQAGARLRDGRLIGCRITRIRDGATLAAFRPLPPDHAIPEGMDSVVRQKARITG